MGITTIAARFILLSTGVFSLIVFVTYCINHSNQQPVPDWPTKTIEFTDNELADREHVASMEQKALYYSQLCIVRTPVKGGCKAALRFSTPQDDVISIPAGISVTLHRNEKMIVCSRDEKRYVLLFHVNSWWYKVIKKDESDTWIVEKEQSEKAEENKQGDVKRALESLTNDS